MTKIDFLRNHQFLLGEINHCVAVGLKGLLHGGLVRIGGGTLPFIMAEDVPTGFLGLGLEILLRAAHPTVGTETEHLLVGDLFHHQLLDDMGHGGKHLVLIGGHAEDQAGGFPRTGQDVANVAEGAAAITYTMNAAGVISP